MQVRSEDTLFTRVMNAVAAGTTSQNSASVNLTGQFHSVLFLAMLGTITAGAVTSIKAQQSSDDGVADGYSDILGTEVAIADDDDNKAFYLDIVRPTKPWVRLVVVRGTQNAVIDGVLACQYNSRSNPVTQTIGGERHSDAAEGTA